MPEVVCQLEGTLVTSVADVADLGRFILLPFFVVEFFVECFQKGGVNEIDEGVSNIAIILQIRNICTSLSIGR